jgi:outer membrane lipoprotein-sorting protein
MKTILTSVLVLLLITSCNKKECEAANQRVQSQMYEVQNASYTYLIDPTQQNHNKLEEQKQQYEQVVIQRDIICK